MLTPKIKTAFQNPALSRRTVVTTGMFLCLLFSVITYAQFTVRDVSASEAATLLQDNPEIKILDVRTGFEYRRGHIKDAVNLNYYSKKFKDQLNDLDKEATWLVHCRTGVRSGKTLPLMEAAGFTSVIHLESGIVDWKKADLPLTK